VQNKAAYRVWADFKQEVWGIKKGQKEKPATRNSVEHQKSMSKVVSLHKISKRRAKGGTNAQKGK